VNTLRERVIHAKFIYAVRTCTKLVPTN